MSAGAKYYITTAIDYSNGPPHVGHALEKVGADAMARYHRLRGDRVHFVIGQDEHGLKVLQSATAAGITPQQWVDGLAEEFQAMWRRLHISNDDFIRTTEPRHTRAVTELLRRMMDSDDLYRGSYAGYYCVGCESFKREDELVRDDTGELRCPTHPSRTIEWTEETNWFFRLSAYGDRILELIDGRPEFVQPESRRNEVRRLVEDGLEDISVSRAGLTWGVPWPDDDEHVVYVWADALINYLSATGFPEPGYDELWPADVHVIGKDITRFHCVIWPAMLMCAGVATPRSVWAHGFINYGGRKVSKSEGVRVELSDAVERHGPDAFRYAVLRDVPWNGDGDFSWDRFDARYTADLADNFGNLINRTLSMIERYRGGTVPSGTRGTLDDEIAAALDRYRAAMDQNLLHQGGAVTMELASAANGYIESRAPWALAKDPAKQSELDDTLAALARTAGALATLLTPFVPGKIRELLPCLGLEREWSLDEVIAGDLAGHTVRRGDVLFPKPDRASA